jgi:hypothetical protein
MVFHGQAMSPAVTQKQEGSRLKDTMSRQTEAHGRDEVNLFKAHQPHFYGFNSFFASNITLT